jgi:hypothetical protein
MKRKSPSLLQRLKGTQWNPAINDDLLFNNDRFKYRRSFLSEVVHRNQRRLEQDFKFCSHFKSRLFRVSNAVRSPWWNSRTVDLESEVWTPSTENAIKPGPRQISSLDDTWFMSRLTHQSQDQQNAPLTSKYLSNAKYTLGNKECIRTRKCQILPTAAQKAQLEVAMRAYNVTRSSCVRWIKKRKELAYRLAVKTDKINPLMDTLRTQFVTNQRRGGKHKGKKNRYFEDKQWMLKVPKEIRVSAVKDVVANLKTCLTNVERGHQSHFTLKLKLKASHCSFGIEKKLSCEKDRERVRMDFVGFFNTNGSSQVFQCIKGHIFKDGVPDADCKVHRDSAGRYFVLLAYKVQKREEVRTL